MIDAHQVSVTLAEVSEQTILRRQQDRLVFSENFCSRAWIVEFLSVVSRKDYPSLPDGSAQNLPCEPPARPRSIGGAV